MNRLVLNPTADEPDPTATLTRSNLPAQLKLVYQGGKYQPTIQRMLASLSSKEALARLNHEAYDDWSIALLHAWAIVTDVLAFYQERITNEGYIRTAVERRSVLALARALGYEWRAGVAANVDLALTVAPDDQDQPQQVRVDKGGAVQSTPAEGKLPQIFETSADADVRTEWNLLLPFVGLAAAEAGAAEPLQTNITSLRVANYRNDLQKEDVILLVDQAKPEPPTAPQAWVLGVLVEVVADPQKPYTIIRWKVDDHVEGEISQPALFVFRQRAQLFPYAQGAVYFDAEEAPQEPPAPVAPPAEKTLANGVLGNGGAGQATSADDGSATNGATGGLAPATETLTSPPKVANWTPRTLSLPNLDINAFIVNAKGMIFAGTKRDLYRSTDHGESWQAVGVDPVGRTITALTLDPDGNLWAGSSTGGLYISYDGGDNWTPVSGDLVAPAIKVKKGPNDGFEVEPPQTLPKAPILELEFGADRQGNTVLYALAGKKLFVADKEGKTWTEIDPNQELPDTQKRLSAEDQRASMVAAAQALLVTTRLKWLEKLIAPLAKAAGSTTWWGLDLWDFLRSTVSTPPAGANTVRALAVTTQGKKSTVVVGTDAGKFTLKEKTRRWLVALVIALLVLVQQFLSNRGQLGAIPVEVAALGSLDAVAITPAGAPVTTMSELNARGTLRFEPALPVTQTVTYTITLRGNSSLAAGVDKKKQMVNAGGNLPLTGRLTLADTQSYTVTFATLSTLTATVAAEAAITNTLFAITTTEAASVSLLLTATVQLTPAKTIWPAQARLSRVSFTGRVAAAPVLPEDPRFAWLTAIWQQTAALLQTTVIAGWNTIMVFLTSLWKELPSWLQNLLAPINTYLVQPVIRFVDVYLIKPLLNYTAATLLDISAITLGVLALLLAWIYADRQMSNRKTVRLEGAVNALAISSKGQIFASTTQGVFRSLADDPNAAWWTKAARLLIRRAFPDAPMEPINNGLTASETDPLPDIRSLTFTNSGALLAGTVDGHIFRLSDPSAELDPTIKSETDAAPGGAPAAVVRWERYDQGIAQDSKSTLKAVRTFAVTPKGQFVAGAMGANKVEEHWFTGQIKELPGQDNQPVKLAEIDLDNVYPQLKQASWVVLRQSMAGATVQEPATTRYARYQVDQVLERVRSQDFVTAGEFTRLIVRYDDRLTTFSRSQAQVLIQSEAIALFDHRPVQGKWLYLDGYVPDLQSGHRLIVNGQQKRALVTQTMSDALRSDNGLERRTLEKGDLLYVEPRPRPAVTEEAVTTAAPGAATAAAQSSALRRWRLRTRDGFVGEVEASKEQIRWVLPAEDDPEVSEVAVVQRAKTIHLSEEAHIQAGLDHAYDRVIITRVELQSELAHVYDRATVTVFANIVPATHGETVKNEVLGSGSGMLANERFVLQEGPLTYISSANGQGVASEIKVYVNEIEWEKVDYLYGLPRDRRAYIVRQDALDQTLVIFGDGKQGARLPTGAEQVTATYRSGLGTKGNAPAYTIDQPQTLPSAIRRVFNPMPAAGGVEPDQPEEVRLRAPLSVRIMDRMVALADYEDFVRLYAGIGRVQLKRFGRGPNLLLHFTVATSNGDVLPENSLLMQNLLQSIEERRAVATPKIQIDSYERLFFDIAAKLLIDPKHQARVQVIEQLIRQKLLEEFSFARREFARDVVGSEVVALLQAVIGVVSVTSVRLQRCAALESAVEEENPSDPLVAKPARLEAGRLRPAQLLLLNPGAEGVQLEIATTAEPLKVLNRAP
jgi:predicted phage baseplate assembly protein